LIHVPHLGRGKRTRHVDLEHPVVHQLSCPEGHVMKARVVREVFNFCEATKECEQCGVECDEQVSIQV